MLNYENMNDEFDRMSKVRPLMQSLYHFSKKNLAFKPDASIAILKDNVTISRVLKLYSLNVSVLCKYTDHLSQSSQTITSPLEYLIPQFSADVSPLSSILLTRISLSLLLHLSSTTSQVLSGESSSTTIISYS